VAGIYIHIPFCRKKCHYCDFYKTTLLGKKSSFLDALYKEIRLQTAYLQGESINTIYIGGGTPSLLTPDEIGSIIKRLSERHKVLPAAEITLEVNPDDVHPDYPDLIKKIGINRLSIGVQSFSDEDLIKLNRRHTAAQALQSVETASESGFKDISIDLIFGLPGLTNQQWRKNLEMAVLLPINHLSAYHLTYHEGTPFFNWLKRGKLVELAEKESIEQFETLRDITTTAGFEQYEISNFAREQAYSKHNSNYWTGEKYLGLGPSAHSYNGISRQWNISDLGIYIDKINSGVVPFEIEMLTERDRINDYLITRIRTKWGISLEYLETRFNRNIRNSVEKSSRNYLLSGHLEQCGNFILLTSRGVMISDQIALALFLD
jgi:oxygen-independent coproporphyrinogen III oxidase